MIFFGFFDGLFEVLYNLVNKTLGYLFLWIAQGIYKWIGSLYELFLAISKSRLLSNENIKILSNRIGLLLGIVMFFIIIISLIQMLLEPDKVNNKDNGVGKILIRPIMVIVMFAFSSFVFEFLYYAQNVLIDSNVISNLLLPAKVDLDDDYAPDGEENDESKKFGNALSYQLFTAFYNVDSDLIDDDGKGITEDVSKCIHAVNSMKKEIANHNNFSGADVCLGYDTTDSNGLSVSIMKFDAILLLITGVVVVYFLFTYCISVGIRMIQLAFLEIISPMAFVSYLSPKKENVFTRWVSIYFSTFLDVFIRIAIISFVVFLINVVFQEFDVTQDLWSNGLANYKNSSLLKVILVVALLSFGKKAPELIKNLIPSTGKSGLDFGLNNAFGAAAVGLGLGAVGGVVGGAIAGQGWKGKLAGGFGGLFRGGAAGMSAKSPANFMKSTTSGFGNAKKATLANEKRIAEGGSRFLIPGISPAIAAAQVANLDKEKKVLEDENKSYSLVSDNYSKIKERAKSKIMDGSFDNNMWSGYYKEAINQANILKQQAGNLKLSDFRGTDAEKQKQYDDRLASLNREIITAENSATKFLDYAIEDYSNEAITNANGDAVIKQAYSKIKYEVGANPNLSGFTGHTVSDFASIKKIDGAANTAKTDNEISISKNITKGKRARANNSQ